MSYLGHLPEIGASGVGMAITDTLYVSPNGSGTNGKTMSSAYQTVQDALDAASTDANDCTLILLGPHATQYDVLTTGDPTWTGNYIIRGSHILWAPIKNTHGSATSLMNFTGKISLQNLGFFQTGSVNGISIASSGFNIKNCGFNSEGLTGSATSIHIDGSAGVTRGGHLDHVHIVGNPAYTKGLHIGGSKHGSYTHMHVHDALTGIHIDTSGSDHNNFVNIDIGDCALGIDIDAGSEQHFDNIDFHHNTRNIDDEVGDSLWTNIHGQFPIYLYPDNFTGITVSSDNVANTWGSLADIVAASAIDNPFRIVGVHFKPAVTQQSRVRFTADNGVVFYDDLFFAGDKREASAAPSGTEFIFNADTRIEAMAKVVGGGPDNIAVWVEIQEI